MTWHALDDLGDALDATKALLLPFDWWVWLRLGIVVAALGGVGGWIGQVTNLFQFGSGPDVDVSGSVLGALGDPAAIGALAQTGMPEFDSDMLVEPAMVLVVAVALLFLLAILLLSTVGTTMEFVIVETLRHERVQVGADFGGNVGNGLRLAIFRFVFFLVVGGLFAAAVVWQLGLDPDGWTETAILEALLPLAAVGLVLIPLSAVVNGFTNVFVVPIMLVEERGLLSAWRRLLGTIAGNVGQFLVYLVVSVLVSIGANVVLGIAGLFALLVIAIPVGIVTVGLLVLLSGPLVWVLGGAVVFVGIVAAVVAGMFILVPLLTFLRYFALFVLGDVEPDLDPIPDVREHVRGEGEIPSP